MNFYSGNEFKILGRRLLFATSNVCERLFSFVGFTMGVRRNGMLPSNSEPQLLLHVNFQLWGVEDVHSLLSEK